MRAYPYQTTLPTAIKGFTLIEIVIVIVIMGIVAAIGSLIMSRGFSSYFTERDITSVDQQARLALERMTRELRLIRVTSSGPDISVMNTNLVTFTDNTATGITYTISAGQLTRNGVPLAANLTALNLSYLTSTGAATVNPAQVFYIQVALTVNQNSITTNFRSTVTPRNFLP